MKNVYIFRTIHRFHSQLDAGTIPSLSRGPSSRPSANCSLHPCRIPHVQAPASPGDRISLNPNSWRPHPESKSACSWSKGYLPQIPGRPSPWSKLGLLRRQELSSTVPRPACFRPQGLPSSESRSSSPRNEREQYRGAGPLSSRTRASLPAPGSDNLRIPCHSPSLPEVLYS